MKTQEPNTLQLLREQRTHIAMNAFASIIFFLIGIMSHAAAGIPGIIFLIIAFAMLPRYRSTLRTYLNS